VQVIRMHKTGVIKDMGKATSETNTLEGGSRWEQKDRKDQKEG
jgi:hypothetical protein